MMYKIINEHNGPQNICVLRISSEIMKLDGVLISDRNASSGYARFGTYPGFLNELDWERVFATSWVDPDNKQMIIKRSIKCAEVLVPGVIPPNYITGIYISSEEANNLTNGFSRNVSVNKDLFFQ